MDEKLMQISESMSFALPKYKAYNFVGGAQITPYARLKQWLLELRGREDAVEHLEYTVRKMELEIQMDLWKYELQFLLFQLEHELHLPCDNKLFYLLFVKEDLIDLS